MLLKIISKKHCYIIKLYGNKWGEYTKKVNKFTGTPIQVRWKKIVHLLLIQNSILHYDQNILKGKVKS